MCPQGTEQLFLRVSSMELLQLSLQPRSDLCCVKPPANYEGECKRCIARAGSMGAKADLRRATRLGCSQEVPAHTPVQVLWAISDPSVSPHSSASTEEEKSLPMPRDVALRCISPSIC